MAVRNIIKIDNEKCNGCGLCVPSCAEGAIQIIDGKARVVKDSFCDGLGACLGHCPQDALEIIEREADDFDEAAAMAHVENIRGSNRGHSAVHNAAHVHNTHAQAVHSHHGGGCPGSRMMMLNQQASEEKSSKVAVDGGDIEIKIKPQLKQWPVQLHLLSPMAPYFDNADLLVAADCVPFAYADFHLDLLKGKALAIGCPKLDDVEAYVEKLTDILKYNNIKSITVAFMEVPCCGGMVRAVEMAAANSGKNVPVYKVKIGLNGVKQ